MLHTDPKSTGPYFLERNSEVLWNLTLLQTSLSDVEWVNRVFQEAHMGASKEMGPWPGGKLCGSWCSKSLTQSAGFKCVVETVETKKGLPPMD